MPITIDGAGDDAGDSAILAGLMATAPSAPGLFSSAGLFAVDGAGDGGGDGAFSGRLAPSSTILIVDIVGIGAAEILPQGSIQPIIFTFTPADGVSVLTLAGTPRFRLAAAASPATPIIAPCPASTSFGSGTASVQATYLLDTTALPPGVYVALCAAGIAGPDGQARVIEAQAVIQIVPGF